MKIDFFRRRGARLASVIVAALMLASGVAMLRSPTPAVAEADAAGSQETQPSVAVGTIRVQRGEIGQAVHAYGVVSTFAGNVESISLPYPVRVEQVRVQPGQRVTRGTPLVVVEADATAVSTAQQAKSALALATGELDRTKALFDQALATRSQIATAQKTLTDAQQAYAQQTKQGIVSGPKTIVAPVEGVVLQIASTQGDQLAAGTTMMQLASVGGGQQRANVVFGVEPADAAVIREGDAVSVHGLSVAFERLAVPGRVVMVGGAIDPQTQLVDVGVDAALAGTPLIPGTRVGADVITRSGMHWIVPRDAVVTDDQGACVYQIDVSNKAHRVPVTIAVENDDRYGVDGALNASEPLVGTGDYELKDGMTVRDEATAAKRQQAPGAASAGSQQR